MNHVSLWGECWSSHSLSILLPAWASHEMVSLYSLLGSGSFTKLFFEYVAMENRWVWFLSPICGGLIAQRSEKPYRSEEFLIPWDFESYRFDPKPRNQACQLPQPQIWLWPWELSYGGFHGCVMLYWGWWSHSSIRLPRRMGNLSSKQLTGDEWKPFVTGNVVWTNQLTQPSSNDACPIPGRFYRGTYIGWS